MIVYMYFHSGWCYCIARSSRAKSHWRHWCPFERRSRLQHTGEGNSCHNNILVVKLSLATVFVCEWFQIHDGSNAITDTYITRNWLGASQQVPHASTPDKLVEPLSILIWQKCEQQCQENGDVLSHLITFSLLATNL